MNGLAGSGGILASLGLDEDALLRACFTESPVGQSVTLPDGRLAHVNRAFAHMLGYEPHELEGRNYADITFHDDLASSDACVRDLLGGAQECSRFEKRYLSKQGNIVWGLVNTRVHRDEAGRPVCFLTHVVDITEMKRIEEAHRHEQTQVETILAATADGILAVDRQGRIMHTSPRFAELWRIPRELVDAGDDDTLLSFVLEQLREPEAFLRRVRELYDSSDESWDTLEFRDGRVFERYSAPMFLDGVPAGRVWSFRDITARRRIEERLVARNQEIEALVRTISHDMRSPLLTIKGFASLLKEDALSPDRSAMLNDLDLIEGATDRMLRLLDDLLDYWNLGRSTEPVVETPLQQLVSEALDVVGSLLLEHGVSVNVSEAPLWIPGRRRELVRVFQNLLENASKYTGNQSEPQVTVGWDAIARETAHIRIPSEAIASAQQYVVWVKDNGAGFEPHAKERLFLPFERLHRSEPGSGLGLAGVRRVVESHGGLLWGESDGPGRGACFSLWLPGSRIP